MRKCGKVAMSPAELPRQRLTAVVELPPCPDGFEVRICPRDVKRAAFRELGGNGPERTVAMLEWAWGPRHELLATYVLERGERAWLLWNWMLEDEFGDVEQTTLLAAASPLDVPERTAAIWLLKARLEFDREETDLDPWHWINSAGLLSVADLAAVERAVWSGN